MLLLVSHCCKISKGKNTSAVTHDDAVKRRLLNLYRLKMISPVVKMACKRSAREAKIDRSYFLETPTNNTGSVEDGKEVNHREEVDCVEK